MLRCAYFSEELEQWMTDGVTTETVQDGHSVVCSATHLTAFSVIAYDSQPVSLSLCTGVYVCMCVCVCVCIYDCVRLCLCVHFLPYTCVFFTLHYCMCVVYHAIQESAVLPVWRIVMLIGCCVAGVLVLLAFVLNFCLW